MNLFHLGLDLQECLRNNNIHRRHDSGSESESDQEPSEELMRRHSYLKPPPFVVDEASLNPNKSSITPRNLNSIKSKPTKLKQVKNQSPSQNRFICLRTHYTSTEESSDDQQSENEDVTNLRQDTAFIKIGRKGKKLLVENSGVPTKNKFSVGMENTQSEQRKLVGNRASESGLPPKASKLEVENSGVPTTSKLSVGMENIQSDQRKLAGNRASESGLPIKATKFLVENSGVPTKSKLSVGVENIQSDQRKLVGNRASESALPTKATKSLQTQASKSGLTTQPDLQVDQQVTKKVTKKKKSQITFASNESLNTNCAVLPTDEFIPVVGKTSKRKKKRSKSLVKVAEIPLMNRFSDLKLNTTDESDVENDLADVVDKSDKLQLVINESEFEIRKNDKLASMQKEDVERSDRMKSSGKNAFLISENRDKCNNAGDENKEKSKKQENSSFPHRRRKSYRRGRNINEEIYAAMFQEMDSFLYLQDVFNVYMKHSFLGCFAIGECLGRLTACKTQVFKDLTTVENNLEYWYGVKPKQELHHSVLLEDFDIREIARAKFVIPVERAQVYCYRFTDVVMYRVVDRYSEKVIEQFEISCGVNKGRENCWSYLGVLLRVFTFIVDIVCKFKFIVKHVYTFFASK